jgi:hypothetical protein
LCNKIVTSKQMMINPNGHNVAESRAHIGRLIAAKNLIFGARAAIARAARKKSAKSNGLAVCSRMTACPPMSALLT